MQKNRDQELKNGPEPGPETPTKGITPAPDTLGVACDLSKEKWDKELEEAAAARAWNASPQKRLAVRVFSRGILGAGGFAFGGWYARRSTGLAGYSPEKWNKAKPLHWIAKFFDTFAGIPIKKAVNALGYNGENAVRFRATSHDFSPGLAGRTLGEEVVGITTDFSLAGGFDRLGRTIIDVADKHVKKDWINEDGSIDANKAINALAKEAWTITSLSMGEDWAVGMPYAYWMKGTRYLWNRAQPGFHYDFDRGLNGGSFKMNNEGQLTGNYHIAGLLNLQERFTMYNMFTNIYQHQYAHIGNLLQGKPSSLYGDKKTAEERAQETVGEKIGNIAKGATRDAIVAGIYMTPAVPFFWSIRTPQSKYKAGFINPTSDSMLFFHDGERYDAVKASEPMHMHGGKLTLDTPVEFRSYEGQFKGWRATSASTPHINPISSGRFNAYQHTFGPVDSALNSLGNASNYGRIRVNQSVRSFGLPIGTSSVERYWNAAVTYTPYMWAKEETRRLWRNNKTNMAVSRFIDGALNLDGKEIKEGFSETMRAIAHQPFKDPARETKAQNLMKDSADPGDAFLDEEPLSRDTFTQRILRDKAEPLHRPHANSFTEQLAMRETLKEMTPLTPSIH